ncbi:MAG: hypothetical protein ACP5QH_07185 [Thermoplasmata archaeon]
MGKLVQLEQRLYIGLVGKDEMRNSITSRNPARIYYRIPVMYRVREGPDRYVWRSKMVPSLADVFNGQNFSPGEVRYAPMLPDPEIATPSEMERFLDEFFSFLRDILEILNNTPKEERKPVFIFISNNYDIWRTFLLMLPDEMREVIENFHSP